MRIVCYVFFLLSISIFMLGCQTIPTSIVGDSPVVKSPYFGYNSIFYFDYGNTEVCPPNHHRLVDVSIFGEKTEVAQVKTTINESGGGEDIRFIKNNEPIAVIINGVRLYGVTDLIEKGSLQSFLSGRKQNGRDIAVVLNIYTSINGGEEVVVWYQQNVADAERLNFLNLHVFQDPSWDERVSPVIRMRIYDVANDKNTELRSSLNKIGDTGTILTDILQKTSFESELLKLGKHAAEMILGSAETQPLLDYRVQFYSRNVVGNVPLADLSPLVKGQLLLMGAPKNGNPPEIPMSGHLYCYNRLEKKVFYRDSSNQETLKLIESPYILMTVVPQDLFVTSDVKERSAQLLQHFESNSVPDITFVEDAEKLLKNAKIAQKFDSFLRFRTEEKLKALILHLQSGPEPFCKQSVNGEATCTFDDVSEVLIEKITQTLNQNSHSGDTEICSAELPNFIDGLSGNIALEPNSQNKKTPLGVTIFKINNSSQRVTPCK